MNIAFYVSGRATRLKKIFSDKRFNRIKDHIKLVYTDNYCKDGLLEIKKNSQIDVDGVQYEDLNGKTKLKNQQLSKIILDKFNSNRIDYCFCFGDHILTSELLDYYQNRIINFHPSILPMFPGRKSIDKAVEKNNFLLGNTAHFIDEGIDTGPIIMQSVVHSSVFEKGNNYDTILDNQIDMFFQILDWILDDRIEFNNNKCVVKNSSFEKVVFYPKIESERQR